ncbi:zinc-binding alcohol dehydrogenase family protein [Sediminitomix flava]|uniref:Zinc-type alcohol dehydrogenase-like protein n=1 Tax=Sediminitomix flava TaxID=379075 RepID=A0A315Z823_SEDFL|nr:zinc-binding alcohol dehydrogenase family protein [Sediminitomix flava]PWJ40896.1 alcohol dehydrogenase [Sediminitomix flava]
MKAIGVRTIDGKNQFIDFETAKPNPSGHELLVEIKAIAINPVDYKVFDRPVPEENEPTILGWDATGTVIEVGEKVTLFKKGDEVFYAGDITKPGCYAQFQLIDERITGFKPKSISEIEAAALPLTSITAYEAIFDRLGIKENGEEGKSILIIGGAGGVGSIATQIAKKMTKLKVLSTASREDTIEWCKNMGADHVVNHHDLIASVRATGFQHVNYILQFNNTALHWDNMIELIAPQGKICSIVETPEKIDLTKGKSKSFTFAWELMFTRSMFQTDDMIEQYNLLNKVAELVDKGEIKTTLNTSFEGFNIENLEKAHEIQRSGKAIGKIGIQF